MDIAELQRLDYATTSAGGTKRSDQPGLWCLRVECVRFLLSGSSFLPFSWPTLLPLRCSFCHSARWPTQLTQVSRAESDTVVKHCSKRHARPFILSLLLVRKTLLCSSRTQAISLHGTSAAYVVQQNTSLERRNEVPFTTQQTSDFNSTLIHKTLSEGTLKPIDLCAHRDLTQRPSPKVRRWSG